MNKFSDTINDLWSRVVDLTAIGSQSGFKLMPSFVSDEKLYKDRPGMFAMYVQFLQGIAQNPEAVYKALAAYNQNELRSKRTKQKILTISSLMKYLTSADFNNSKDICKDSNDNYPLAKRINAAFNENIVSQGVITVSHNCPRQGDNLLKRAGNVVVAVNRMATGAAAAAARQPEGAAMEGGSGQGYNVAAEFLQSKLDSIREAEAKLKDPNTADKETLEARNVIESNVKEVMNHPTYNDQVTQINNYDRVIFISTTFIVRGLALFLVDWGINSYFIDTFAKAFYMYIFVYMLLLLVIIALANTSGSGGYGLNFRIFFYYLNVEHNGIGRILIHFLMQFLLVPIMFVIRTNDETASANISALNYEQKRRIYRVISNLTMFFWALTSVIALRY